MSNTITVHITVRKDIDVVWDAWITPHHIQQWLHASADWECPHAENNVMTGGRFLSRMSAKDKSASFDFTGEYTEVIPHKLLEYKIDDGRMVKVVFEEKPDGILITETFEMENVNPREMQNSGWQAILDNFKRYAENL